MKFFFAAATESLYYTRTWIVIKQVWTSIRFFNLEALTSLQIIFDDIALSVYYPRDGLTTITKHSYKVYK